MITDISIVQNDGELRYYEWRFWFDDSHYGQLVLNNYLVWERKTTRHKWAVTSAYHRLERRATTIAVEDVPWNETIARNALAKFVERITVVKEQRRR